MKKIYLLILIVVLLITISGCDTSGTKEYQAQEKAQLESIAQVGTPSIKTFREKRILKDIYELRDQAGLVTYTYIIAESTGKLIFLGETIGYGIPAATQYNNPMKSAGVPQAEPNGLYSPATAEGTWILMKNPEGGEALPVYIEPRILVYPFKIKNL